MGKQRGFTLIELIAVIILLTISGIAVYNFIGFGAQIFAGGVERGQLSGSARFAANRFSRELKEALPGSVNVSNGGNCIEFLPIKTAGQYISLARNSSQTMSIITPVGEGVEVGDTIQVSSVSDTVSSVTDGSIDGTTEITLENGLNRESRAKRYYIIKSSVEYCVAAGDLLRDGTLMSEGIEVDGSGIPFFTAETPTLRRNGLVRVYLPFVRKEQKLTVDIEVPIKNVP